jgi:hypothetical protein
MFRRVVMAVPVLSLVMSLATVSAAVAQQRPLVTEDPEVIGQGRILLEGGVAYGQDIFFPASGLRGDLLTVPDIGVSIGLGSIVELQIDGSMHSRLDLTDRTDAPLSPLLDFTGDRTSSVGDFVVATKFRFVTETSGRPAFGLRLATKLPNAPNEKGLGLDTMDFYSSLLIGKTVRSIRIVGNVGVGILSDPTNATSQNDVLTVGASVARAVTDAFEVVGEVNGRIDTRAGEPSPGTESRGTLRVGVRFTQATVRVDAALITGMTVRDPSWGFSAGATYVFDAFRNP